LAAAHPSGAQRSARPTISLIRVSLAELESRAGKRKPGYVEAFMSVAKLEEDGQHLLISEEALRHLWRTHTAPGLGDELLNQPGCCGG
jgi:hypothetical protein